MEVECSSETSGTKSSATHCQQPHTMNVNTEPLQSPKISE